MSSRFLTLGILLGLAGSGAGLRAQQWQVTAGILTFDGVTALSVNTLTLPTDPGQLPTITNGSFSRPWRGDQVLEGLQADQTTVDLGFASAFLSAGTPSFVCPVATVTQWELTAEDGLFATESVVFNDAQVGRTTY